MHDSSECSIDVELSEKKFLVPVDDAEIGIIINGLKSSSHMDILGISSNMLKKNVHTLAPILTHFVNQSFLNGKVDDSLKTAIVLPFLR